MSYRKKIVSRETMLKIATDYRQQGKVLIMSGGVFDILHPAHARLLQRAKLLGDILVVALNSDESTRLNKGPKRPINSQNDRAEMLAAMAFVDYVTVFEELTPVEIVSQVKPHIWVKGGNYEIDELPETPVVREYGGKVQIFALEDGFSVTSLVERIIRTKPIKKTSEESYTK